MRRFCEEFGRARLLYGNAEGYHSTYQYKKMPVYGIVYLICVETFTQYPSIPPGQERDRIWGGGRGACNN